MITKEGEKTMWLEWVKSKESEKPQTQKQQVQMFQKPQLENHTPSGARHICLNCKAILQKKPYMKGASMLKTISVSIE